MDAFSRRRGFDTQLCPLEETLSHQSPLKYLIFTHTDAKQVLEISEFAKILENCDKYAKSISIVYAYIDNIHSHIHIFSTTIYIYIRVLLYVGILANVIRVHT